MKNHQIWQKENEENSYQFNTSSKEVLILIFVEVKYMVKIIFLFLHDE
jgi:hypothetical protein